MTAIHLLPTAGPVPPRPRRHVEREWHGRNLPPAHSPLSWEALRASALDSIRDDPRPSLAARLRAEYEADEVLLLHSGTHALTLALLIAECVTHAPNLVALPAYSCFQVATAAAGAGVRIALYDVDPQTLEPDLDSLIRTMSAGARVVVVAPLYGIPVDWEAIEGCAAAFGALVIEDAAQGFGSLWRGRRLGSQGRLSVLSFGRGKGWTGGCGGALLARGGILEQVAASHEFAPAASPPMEGLLPAVAQWALGRPSLYGLPRALPMLHLGETRYAEPTRVRAMPRVAAGLLLHTLALATEEAEVRRRHAATLCAGLAGLRVTPFADRVRLMRPTRDAVPGFLRLPLRLSHGLAGLPDAERAGRYGIAPGYPDTLASLRPVRRRLELSCGEVRWLGAEELVRELVTLPTHSLVTAADRRELVRLVAGYHA